MSKHWIAESDGLDKSSLGGATGGGQAAGATALVDSAAADRSIVAGVAVTRWICQVQHDDCKALCTAVAISPA